MKNVWAASSFYCLCDTKRHSMAMNVCRERVHVSFSLCDFHLQMVTTSLIFGVFFSFLSFGFYTRHRFVYVWILLERQSAISLACHYRESNTKRSVNGDDSQNNWCGKEKNIGFCCHFCCCCSFSLWISMHENKTSTQTADYTYNWRPYDISRYTLVVIKR